MMWRKRWRTNQTQVAVDAVAEAAAKQVAKLEQMRREHERIDEQLRRDIRIIQGSA